MRHARELVEEGHAVLEGLFTPAEMERLRAALRAERARAGSPPLYAEPDLVVAEDVKVSAVGLTFFGLLGRLPETADLLLAAPLVALCRRVLGPALELEQVCAVMSDHTRPFFFWHNHVGGIDGEDHRRGPWPRPARVDRLVCTVYATPLDRAHGQMLVHPRAATDSVAPPHPPGRAPWPGAVALDAPAGSVVVLDQACWHAVTPMSAEGERCFAAFFVRRAGLAPTARVDPTVAGAIARDGRLARAYRAAPGVDGARRGRG